MKKRLFKLGRERGYDILFVVALLVFLYYSFLGINDPLSGSHHGYVIGEKAAFALNYLKFGFLDTKFGQRQYTGWMLDEGTDGPYEYYVHHPVMVSILVALSFLLFGVKESAARIVAIVFNFCTIMLLYAYAKEYWNRRVAFFAVFFMVASTMLFYIRNFVCWESTALAFINLLLLIYVLWLDNRIRLRYFFLTFFIGTFTEWQVYFLVPPLVIHYVFMTRMKRGWHFLLIIPIAILGFEIFLGHVYLLTGSPFGADKTAGSPSSLYNQLLFRLNIYEPWHIEGVTFDKIYDAVKNGITRYYSKMLLYAPVVLVLGLLVKLVWTRKFASIERDSLPLLLYLSYIAWLFLFSNQTLIHDFQLYSLIPALPILGAVALNQLAGVFEFIADKTKRIRLIIVSLGGIVTLIRGAFIIAVLALYVNYSYPVSLEIYKAVQPEPIIRFLSGVNENIIVNYDQDPNYFQMRFYTNRVKTKKITDFNTFDIFMNTTNKDKSYRYFITWPYGMDANLDRNLRENYIYSEVPANPYQSYFVYDLKWRKA